MKLTTLTLALLTLVIGKTLGQTIPNNGFESWALMPMWYEDPQSWKTNNGYLIWPVRKDSNAYSGTYSLKINYTWALAKGTASVKYAAALHPALLKAKVMTDIAGADTVMIHTNVYFMGNLVDQGTWINTSSINTWTSINIPITTNSTVLDSLEIIITGGWNMATSINVDDLAFIQASGTSLVDYENELNFAVYPNPAKDKITLSKLKNVKQIAIVDACGKVVFAKDLVGDGEIELSLEYAGIYFIRATTSNGIINKKLVVTP